MVVLAATCDRAALLTDYVIAEKVSGLGFLLLAAVYISSASSCLATLYGTPRVLQSIASENVIPAIAKLAEGVSIFKSHCQRNYLLCESMECYVQPSFSFDQFI